LRQKFRRETGPAVRLRPSTVKNEADIIEAFVRHNLAFVDRLVVLDNGSTDGTLAILRQLEREPLAIDVVEDPSPGKYQSQRMTRLMREHAIGRFRADWILPLDADEFLILPDDQPLIPPEADGRAVLQMFWRVHVPHESDDHGELNPVLRLRHRCVERSSISKAMIPGALAAAPDAMLPQGSHELWIVGTAVPARPHPTAMLAHFPVRSSGQFLAKVIVNSLQYRAMGAHVDVDKGPRYRAAYEQFKRDPASLLADFHHQAPRYCTHPAHDRPQALTIDPLPYRGGPLRHTRAMNDAHRALLDVLHLAEDLAVRYGSLGAADPSAPHTQWMEEQSRVVADFRSQLDRLVLQLGEKELCIQRQAWDIAHVHEQWTAAERAWRQAMQHAQPQPKTDRPTGAPWPRRLVSSLLHGLRNTLPR
jgi:hypothetical protein